MLKIYNIKEKPEYIKDYFTLCSKEWGTSYYKNNFEEILNIKMNDFLNKTNDQIILVLILLDGNNLVGFVSLFNYDCDELPNLSPWYSTLYVKDEYRGLGYSKLLTEEILKEAKKLGHNKLYLKTELNNFYEKYGAHFVEYINDLEKLYYINLK